MCCVHTQQAAGAAVEPLPCTPPPPQQHTLGDRGHHPGSASTILIPLPPACSVDQHHLELSSRTQAASCNCCRRWTVGSSPLVQPQAPGHGQAHTARDRPGALHPRLGRLLLARAGSCHFGVRGPPMTQGLGTQCESDATPLCVVATTRHPTLHFSPSRRTYRVQPRTRAYRMVVCYRCCTAGTTSAGVCIHTHPTRTHKHTHTMATSCLLHVHTLPPQQPALLQQIRFLHLPTAPNQVQCSTQPAHLSVDLT